MSALRKLLDRRGAELEGRTLSEIEQELEAVRTQQQELEARAAEAAQAIEEVEVDELTEEIKTQLEKEVTEIEEEEAELSARIAELESKKKESEDKIAELTADLDEPDPTPAEDKELEQERQAHHMEVRTVNTGIIERGAFKGMTFEGRDRFVEREEIQEFLTRFRTAFGEKREAAITGARLLIPDTVLGFIEQNVDESSKLLKYVNVHKVKGTGRIKIVGEFPEAVWTEACAKLNELKFTFNQVELDGYKVGGYVFVCKATLEDSDAILLDAIMSGIASSIGRAIDKAILYGTGKKMPLGIVTRLAQSAKPENYDENAIPWEDLSKTSLVKLAGTAPDKKWAGLIKGAGVMKSYGSEKRFWAMSTATYNTMLADLIAFNSSGAIVSELKDQMPILGGDIVILDFIPEGDIVGGYGDAYIVLNRRDMEFDTSYHAQWIEQNVGVMATARMDGIPATPKAFAVFNYNNAAITTEVTFAPDKANTEPDPGP